MAGSGTKVSYWDLHPCRCIEPSLKLNWEDGEAEAQGKRNPKLGLNAKIISLKHSCTQDLCYLVSHWFFLFDVQD